MQTCTHAVIGDLQLSTYPCCSLQPSVSSTGQGYGWGGLPCLLPILQVLTALWRAASAVPVRGQGAAGCLCRGNIRFWLLLFSHHDLPLPLQMEILLLYFLLCFKSWCNFFVAIFSGLWSSTSLTLWVLGWFCVFDPDMLFTATRLS